MQKTTSIRQAKEIVAILTERTKKHKIEDYCIIQPLGDLEKELKVYPEEYDEYQNQVSYVTTLRVIDTRIQAIDYMIDECIKDPLAYANNMPARIKIIVGILFLIITYAIWSIFYLIYR